MVRSLKKLRDSIGRKPLSDSIRSALRLAEQAGDEELRSWCRLELGGYWESNPALTDDTVVPKYRSVVGQHTDIYGRPLVLRAKLSFINETRLRNGVEELEALRTKQDVIAMHDPSMCDIIREFLEVDVYSFRFSTVHLTGILSAIGMELEDHLAKLTSLQPDTSHPTAPPSEEILELKPNLYGVGIDLRALWRRWKSQTRAEDDEA